MVGIGPPAVVWNKPLAPRRFRATRPTPITILEGIEEISRLSQMTANAGIGDTGLIAIDLATPDEGSKSAR